MFPSTTSGPSTYVPPAASMSGPSGGKPELFRPRRQPIAEAVEDEEELEILDCVAGQDQHPFHRRSIPHARKGRSTTTARSGNRAAAKKPARQEVDSTNGANASGVNATATPSSVCWSPSAAPLRLGPAVSTVAAT